MRRSLRSASLRLLTDSSFDAEFRGVSPSALLINEACLRAILFSFPPFFPCRLLDMSAFALTLCIAVSRSTVGSEFGYRVADQENYRNSESRQWIHNQLPYLSTGRLGPSFYRREPGRGERANALKTTPTTAI